MRHSLLLLIGTLCFGLTGCDVHVEDDGKPDVIIKEKRPDVEVTTPRTDIKVDVDKK